MTRLIFLLFSFILNYTQISAQDVSALLKNVRAKMDLVKDYKASGNLKTDVSFLQIPVSKVNIVNDTTFITLHMIHIKKNFTGRAFHCFTNHIGLGGMPEKQIGIIA